MDELVREFLNETGESVKRIRIDLDELSREPSNQETLNKMHRAIQKVRYVSTFLALQDLEQAALSAEEELVKKSLRQIDITPEILSSLNGAIHRIQSIIDGLLILGPRSFSGKTSLATTEPNETLDVEPPRILFVNDSRFFGRVMTQKLEKAGYLVTITEDMDSALKIVDQDFGFDVIILDVKIPKIDSFEFAKVVRGGGPCKEACLVALVERPTASDHELSHTFGFNGCLPKYRSDLLVDRLDQLIARKTT